LDCENHGLCQLAPLAQDAIDVVGKLPSANQFLELDMELNEDSRLRSQGALSRRDTIGLLVLSLLYLGVWTWASTLTCLWTDEDFTYHAVIKDWAGMFAFLHEDVHPPLYFILAKIWYLACGWMGDATSLRLLSTLAGIAGLWVYFILFRRFSARGQAPWLAVVLLALAPSTSWYAEEARSYQFLLLAFAVAWLALLSFLEDSDSGIKIMLLGLCWRIIQ